MNINLKLQPRQIEALKCWQDNESEEILFGGAKGGAKSFTGASLTLIDNLLYPGIHTFIARESLNDLVKHTTPTLYEVLFKMGIDPQKYLRFDAQKNYFTFYNQSKLFYLDCKYLPSDPDFHRFGSLQFTRGWMEEIGQIDNRAIVNLSASVGRWKNEDYKLKRKLFLTCNPNKGFAYSNFYLPNKAGTLPVYRKFIKSLVTDNKYISKDYIESLNRLPENEKQRLLYGNWEYDSDPSALISGTSIEDLFTNIFVQEGEKYIIADIARYGSDRAIITVWNGLRLIDYVIFDTSSTVDIQNCINAFRMKYNVQLSNILVDQDGVGGGVQDNLHCQGFVNNGSAYDSQYQNRKSECGYKLAEMINQIYIACDLPEKEKGMIRQELGQLKTFESDKDGKLRILPKEKIKDIIGRSPDWLDIFIMRMEYFVKPVYRGITFLN